MEKEKTLIIFIKNPEKGKVKTRLGASIGSESAFSVYQKLLSHTRKICERQQLTRQVWYSSFVDQEDEWSPEKFDKHLQKGEGLGDRMENAFEYSFNQGYKYVVIIGSDCPGLSGKHIKEAFEALKTTDIVIGPAEDGGYYLLGMKKFNPGLFRNINWSTETVFEHTVHLARGLNLNYKTLPVLNDIDTAEDLVKSGFINE